MLCEENKRMNGGGGREGGIKRGVGGESCIHYPTTTASWLLHRKAKGPSNRGALLITRLRGEEKKKKGRKSS